MVFSVLLLLLLIIGCVALLLSTQKLPFRQSPAFTTSMKQTMEQAASTRDEQAYSLHSSCIVVPTCCEMVQCSIVSCGNEQAEREQQVPQDIAVRQEHTRHTYALYDSMKQELFAISMHLGTAKVLLHQDIDAARASVYEAEKLLRQIQRELMSPYP